MLSPFSSVHQVEGFVDLGQWQVVRHEFVYLHLSLHVLVNQLGNAVSALPPAKRRSLPRATGDELKGARGYFLPCRRHADDGRHAPAFVARLEGSSLKIVRLISHKTA